MPVIPGLEATAPFTSANRQAHAATTRAGGNLSIQVALHTGLTKNLLCLSADGRYAERGILHDLALEIL
jgi:hypothetical protein